MKVIVGVDSGVTGAVSFIGPGDHVSVHDLPVIAVAFGEVLRNKLDAYSLARLLRDQIPADCTAVCYLEQLHARDNGGKNGMQSQGVMMETFGAVVATLQILRIPTKRVVPQTWKRFYKLGKEKNESREMAARLYPDMQERLKRVKDHGRAESLLIAHFGAVKELE